MPLKQLRKIYPQGRIIMHQGRILKVGNPTSKLGQENLPLGQNYYPSVVGRLRQKILPLKWGRKNLPLGLDIWDTPKGRKSYLQFLRCGSPCNTMRPALRPTCMPSFILIYATVWPQYSNVTQRQNRQTENCRITQGELSYTVKTRGKISYLQGYPIYPTPRVGFSYPISEVGFSTFSILPLKDNNSTLGVGFPTLFRGRISYLKYSTLMHNNSTLYMRVDFPQLFQRQDFLFSRKMLLAHCWPSQYVLSGQHCRTVGVQVGVVLAVKRLY